MTLLLLLLLLLVVVVVVLSGTARPTVYRRRPRPDRRIVHEVVYDDAPVIEEEIVEDVPVSRTRRRIVDY